MWPNFIIPTILNIPELFKGNIGGFAKNVALGGGINQAMPLLGKAAGPVAGTAPGAAMAAKTGQYINPALLSSPTSTPALMSQNLMSQRYINPALVSSQESSYVDNVINKYKPPVKNWAEKGLEYAKENPMMVGLGGLAIYRGLNPQRPRMPATLGPRISGGQVAMGAPLQIQRNRRRS